MHHGDVHKQVVIDRSIMAMVMENQQPLALVPAPPPLPPPTQMYKHCCKVCKKGFMCGRALGGHMRAHGVTDDVRDDNDDSGSCGAGDSSEATSTAKRMYALRTNPDRLKNCRVCKNCGKEFTSWKSLLDHGRCSNDEGDDDLDGGNIGDADNEGEEREDLALASGWSKGKRTRRAKVMIVGNGSVTEEQVLVVPSSEEEDLANFLVMLSSSSSSAAQRPQVVVEVDQEESDVASKDDEQSDRQLLVPQPISILAPTVASQIKLLAPPQAVLMPHHAVSNVPRGMFECKACKKVFTSHQALGGHRASHKKVKGCFAAKLESNRTDPAIVTSATDKVVVVDTATTPAIVGTKRNTTSVVDGNTVNAGAAAVGVIATSVAPEIANDEVPAAPSTAGPFKKKGKVHECSICHRVFMSGQALGGHKRCHWLTTGASDPSAKLQPFVTQDHVIHVMCQQLTLRRPVFEVSDPFLDLNVATNPSAAEPPAATRQTAELSLNAPASLHMHSWAGHSNASNMNNTVTSGHYDAGELDTATEDDEADSTSAKRAKISDLKDMNVAGETSPWLQVGIGLTSEIDEEKAAQV